MPIKYLAATMLALVVLSGCSSTGANNTTYAQWYGPIRYRTSAQQAPAACA